MLHYTLHIKGQEPIVVTFKDKAQSRDFLKEGNNIVTLNTEKGSIFISAESFVALVPKDVDVRSKIGDVVE